MKGSKGGAEVAVDDGGQQFVNYALLAQQLPRQTPRWCHLTLSLLSLVVHDTQRNVDPQALSGFLEVIYWRAHGKITSEEFSVLFNEWMHAESKPGVSNTKKKTLMTPAPLRAVVLEKRYLESDLDLFIGIIIHEINTKLLNTTISYGNKRSRLNLEVVTERWLSLSEELFFSLDTPGYGSLRCEECFFYAACLIMGLQGWKTENELEADLSLTSLTATAFQFLKECGVSSAVISSRSNAIDAGRTNGKASRLQSNGKHEITLSMFKRHLIKRSLGEGDLALLIGHVKQSIELLVKLAKISGAEDLYLACQPYELRGAVIGSPRLWQEAVLLAAGFQPSPASSAPQPLPPVLLYLLSDAEKLVSVSFRALEFPIDEEGFLPMPEGSQLSYDLHRPDHSNPLVSHTAANDELHDNASRLYSSYRRWVQEGPKHSALLASADLSRDPIYQLFLSVLLQYKRLQQLLSAALFDLSISHYGSCPMQEGQAGQLAVLCAGLLPNSKDMLVDLGLEDEQYDDKLHVDELSVTESFTSAPAVPAPVPPVSAGRRSSLSSSLPLPRETESDNGDIGDRRISSMPAAAKRRSSLIDSAMSTPAPAAPAPAASAATATPSAVLKGKPNYFKPTSTFLARTNSSTPEEMLAAAAPAKGRPAVKKAPSSSLDKDLAAADWKPLMDARSRSAPPRRADSSAGSSPATSSVQQAAPVGNALADLEAELLSRLLSATGTAQQSQLIEQLRQVKIQQQQTQQTQSAAERGTRRVADAMMPPPPPPPPSVYLGQSHSPMIRSPPSPPYTQQQQNAHGSYNYKEGSVSEASSIPSSIAEMLQAGQSPGKYAAMLRDILRKMSRDDSHVRIRSLEQVLQLGQEIVKKETSPVKQQPSPPKGRYAPFTLASSGSYSAVSSPPSFASSTPRYPSAPRYSQREQPAPAMGSKVISRSSNAPGVMPDRSAKKNIRVRPPIRCCYCVLTMSRCSGILPAGERGLLHIIVYESVCSGCNFDLILAPQPLLLEGRHQHRHRQQLLLGLLVEGQHIRRLDALALELKPLQMHVVSQDHLQAGLGHLVDSDIRADVQHL